MADWKEGASLGAEISASGGFLWLVFRLLVGSAMADAVRDINTLKNDYAGLKDDMSEIRRMDEMRDAKLDRLLERLADNRA